MPNERDQSDHRAQIERDRETVRPRDPATNEGERDPRDRRRDGDAAPEERKD